MAGVDQVSRSSDLARGTAFINAGQARLGLALVQSHLASNPDDPEAYAQLAQAYVNLDEYAAARDAAVRSLALRPDQEHPLRLLAYALAQLGDRRFHRVVAHLHWIL